MSLSRVETPQHREVRDAIWAALQSWRRFVIGIDGCEGAGKSTLGRYLAWQLGMPAVEIDTFTDREPRLLFREADFGRVVRSRLDLDRPVIVEGLFLVERLRTIGVAPDYLIFVDQENHEGGHLFAQELDRYQRAHRTRERAHFTFLWKEPDPQFE